MAQSTVSGRGIMVPSERPVRRLPRFAPPMDPLCGSRSWYTEEISIPFVFTEAEEPERQESVALTAGPSVVSIFFSGNMMLLTQSSQRSRGCSPGASVMTKSAWHKLQGRRAPDALPYSMAELSDGAPTGLNPTPEPLGWVS